MTSLTMVDNKIYWNEANKERFNCILDKLDCNYKTMREETDTYDLWVFYTMENGELYIYTENMYGIPVSIERMR